MGWGANQWLRITKESTWGEYEADPDPGDVIWARLTGGNAYTVRREPQRVVLRSADAGNRRIQQVASRNTVAGNLTTPWYPSQAAFFLEAATGLAGDALPSYTLDYFDTTRPTRTLGARVRSFSINGTAQGDYIPLSIAWVAQKAEALPLLAKPDAKEFPSDLPYKHIESKGGLTIAGAVANYSALQVTIGNVLIPTWDEDEWITALYYGGRDIDLTLRWQYQTRKFRDALEAGTPLAALAKWQRAGGIAATFDLKAKNYVATVADDIPIDGATYQGVTIQTFFDAGTGVETDATFTVA